MATCGLTQTNSQPRLSELMDRTLMLDLETTRSGRIRHIGAILNGRVFERKEGAGSSTVLNQLDEFSADAEFVLGHNLLGHDFPVLQSASPWLQGAGPQKLDSMISSESAKTKGAEHEHEAQNLLTPV